MYININITIILLIIYAIIICRAQDPCSSTPNPCGQGVLCIASDEAPFYECGECEVGFELFNFNGTRNCIDENECEESPCHLNVTCINNIGSYTCPPCPPGYFGTPVSGKGRQFANDNKQICEDIDECLIITDACHKNRACFNLPGTFLCGNCFLGYMSTDVGDCELVDWCAARLDNCDTFESYCIPVPMGFHCVCREGFIGNGIECSSDSDNDGVPLEVLTFCNETDFRCRVDNCPTDYNPRQEDEDGDGVGDACDIDEDNDTIPDEYDNCIHIWNRPQHDRDDDGIGNECDNCPNDFNPAQRDYNRNKQGDMCDDDIDGDGYTNDNDNCPDVSNIYQRDVDFDSVGDRCDNCMYTYNPNQDDFNLDGIGDACLDDRLNIYFIDSDLDGVSDWFDNCWFVPNSDQLDKDGDGVGDACSFDDDGDGHHDYQDNCPYTYNPDQTIAKNSKYINRYRRENSYPKYVKQQGEICSGDFDGDQIPNEDDVCDFNPNYGKTDFWRHQIINLDTNDTIFGNPDWNVSLFGDNVYQNSISTPTVLISTEPFNCFEFSGSLTISNSNSNNFVGLVWSFQSLDKYYVAIWKQSASSIIGPKGENITANPGLTVKLVKATADRYNTLPTANILYDLYSDTERNSRVKEITRRNTGEGWQHSVTYMFAIYHKPYICQFRIYMHEANSPLTADSSIINDCSLTGGKVGFFSMMQDGVKWENLKIKCLDDYECF